MGGTGIATTLLHRDRAPRRHLRLLLLLPVALALALPVPGPTADAAPAVLAKIKITDTPPSWAAEGNWIKHSSPVVANLGPHGKVILVGNPAGKLYALKYTGSATLQRVWTATVGAAIDSSPAVADLNGDGCPEVVVGVTSANTSAGSSGDGVHVYDCNGKQEQFWPAPPYVQADMTGVFATPAIGDVNGDGRLDVAYGSYNTKIYVKDLPNRDLPGWPKMMDDTIWSSPAMADINGDGRKEIITGTDSGGGGSGRCAKSSRGTLAIFWSDAVYTPNMPKCVDTPIWSSPALQDVNGDRHLDVIVGTNNYQATGTTNVVRAWDTITGKLLWQTSLGGSSMRVFASPAIGDVGGDGALDVAIGTLGSGVNGSMYLLNARTGQIEWSKGIDAQRWGVGGFLGSPVIADVTGDGKPDVVECGQNGTVTVWDRGGSTVLGTPFRPDDVSGARTWQFANSPAVADLDGDGRNEIVVAGGDSGQTPKPGVVWVLSASGSSSPWPFFKRTTDRISSVGSGTGGPAGPPPATLAPVSRPSGSSSSTRTPSSPGSRVTPTPSATVTATPGVSETPGPTSFAAPSIETNKPKSSRLPLAVAAGALVAGGIGLAVVAWLRRRAA